MIQLPRKTVSSFQRKLTGYQYQWYRSIFSDFNSCVLFFAILVASLSFRLTCAETSGWIFFRIFFIGSNEPSSNFRGTLGDHYHSRLHLLAWITKNTLLSFKRQKRTQLLKDRLAWAQETLRLIWVSNHFTQMSDWELFARLLFGSIIFFLWKN